MKTRSLLFSAAALCALTASANATNINGWYVGLEGGANWIEDLDLVRTFDPNPPGGPVTVLAQTFQVDTGWAVLATVGYGFGGHWRMELEGGYRHNDTTLATKAEVEEWSGMANVLYDFHLTPKLDFTLGAGAGGDFANLKVGVLSFDEDEWNFAYQGIAGLSYALTNHLDLTISYRYFRVLEPEFNGPAVVPGPGAGTLNVAFDDVVKHTASIGLRYAFGAPEPAPEPMVAPPPPPPPPPPEAPKQFIVFFGFNKCNITAEADNVLGEAANTAKSAGSASIQIVGHTDTSGSNKYNQKLSECRANAAKSNLVGKGIPAASISAIGKGETELMVQTGDGVKEPQNRRAQINLQ
jgi:outer membrane protein OmpA-like peptidoglycan-associated protein